MTTAAIEIRALRWSELLRDGTPLEVRPILPVDEPRERRFLDESDRADDRNRFIGRVPDRRHIPVQSFTHADRMREVTLVALIDDDGEALEVGVACMRIEANGVECDCSVAVSPDWQQRGIGRSLMNKLIDTARRRGVRRMYAVDAAQCHRAHALAQRLGFRARQDRLDPAVTTFELELFPDSYTR